MDIVDFLMNLAWDLTLRFYGHSRIFQKFRNFCRFFLKRAGPLCESVLCANQCRGPDHGAAKPERGLPRDRRSGVVTRAEHVPDGLYGGSPG